MKWEKGQSGNPKGRPRTGLAFAERVRERIDPDLVIDLALRLAADENVPVGDRLAALLPLIDRGFLKPPTAFVGKLETTTTNGDATTIAARIEAMTLEERRAALDHARAFRVLTVGNDTSNG